MRSALSFILVVLLALSGWGRELQVKSGLEESQVRLGESVQFQVLVDGDQPAPPDLTPLRADFVVEENGHRQVNNSSVQIVNGQITRTQERGTLYAYQLSPKRTGRIVIPALKVTDGATMAMTAPATLTVLAADQTQQCRLSCVLPERPVYVGEQVVVKFLLRLPAGLSQIRGMVFSLPAGDSGVWRAWSEPQAVNRVGVVGMSAPVGVTVENEAANDGDYVVLTLRAVWIPKQAGRVAIGGGSVKFQVPDGRSRHRSQDPFAEMEEMLGGASWRALSAIAEEQSCEVRELPSAGRPEAFSGLVARRLRARLEAKPVEAKVGDPLQLTLTLENDNPFPADLPRPDWRRLLPVDQFKVPQDAEDGSAVAGGVVFAQSIRALSPEVREIPALALPYFNPESGQYAVASTEAIPLKIEASRVVTAADAEGGAAASASRGVESARGGVAANVCGVAVLEDQGLGWSYWQARPVWLAGLFLSPLAWLSAVVGAALWRRYHSDPVRLRSRRAAANLEAALRRARDLAAVASAFQGYLGDKLNMPPGAIILADLQRRLPISAAPELRDGLERLFAAFDLCRYGGGQGAVPESLRRDIGQVVQALEKML